MPRQLTTTVERAERRELPGGGFVAIDVTVMPHRLRAAQFAASLVVERRADRSRRAGHQPPVVTRVSADSRREAVERLLPIYLDNASIGAAIVRRSHEARDLAETAAG